VSEHDEPKTALTRLLTRHRDRFHGMEADCSCGAWSTTAEESPGGHVEPFAAHLADVLLAEGYTTSPAPETTEREARLAAENERLRNTLADVRAAHTQARAALLQHQTSTTSTGDRP
jgi:hypothetical protein